MQDFDAALAAAERTTVDFRLGGHEFKAAPIDDLPWTALAHLAKDADADPVGAVDGFLEIVLNEPDDKEAWAAVNATLSVRGLKMLLEWLVKVYSGHPTQRPSVSTDGPPATGQPSKVVSLSQATRLHRERSAASGA